MFDLFTEIVEEAFDLGSDMFNDCKDWVTGEGYPPADNYDDDDDDYDQYEAELSKERQRRRNASKERFGSDVKDIFNSTAKDLNGVANVKLVNSQNDSFESCNVNDILALKNLLSSNTQDLHTYKNSCEKNGIPLIGFENWNKTPKKTKSDISDISKLQDKVKHSLVDPHFDWKTSFPIDDSKRWIDDTILSNLLSSINTVNGNDTLKLVVCGQLKAGKSTFLNCVTGHCEKELFNTDDVRATIKNQSFVKDGVEYIDTPGIDAEQCDEQEAMNALKNADCVIFTHNISHGELNEEERSFLEKVAKNFNSKSAFSKKCLLLLTRLDEKSPEEAARIEEKIQSQLKKIFGKKLDSALISSTRYIKGCLEGKNILLERSGYMDCLKTLGQKIDFCKYDAGNERKIRLKKCVEAINNKLNQVLNTKKDAYAKYKSQLNAALSNANSLILERTIACIEELKSIK